MVVTNHAYEPLTWYLWWSSKYLVLPQTWTRPFPLHRHGRKRPTSGSPPLRDVRNVRNRRLLVAGDGEQTKGKSEVIRLMATRNPAITSWYGSLSHYLLGFYTSQVVFSPDFWTINSSRSVKGWGLLYRESTRFPYKIPSSQTKSPKLRSLTWESID